VPYRQWEKFWLAETWTWSVTSSVLWSVMLAATPPLPYTSLWRDAQLIIVTPFHIRKVFWRTLFRFL
jgi:hypothetical protein